MSAVPALLRASSDRVDLRRLIGLPVKWSSP